MSKEWIEQVEEDGHVFVDTYLHPGCDFIKLWGSRKEFGEHKYKKMIAEIKKKRGKR